MADAHPPRTPAPLPPGTRLDTVELRRVLGIGGFGIVYLAFDHALQREVAVKEYLPGALAARQDGGSGVLPTAAAHAEPFALGLQAFIGEAQLLARINAPGLVKVQRHWEANGTAYMVMTHLAGGSLQAARRHMSGPPGEAWLRGLLAPLLEALEQLHRMGICHRDVSPENVLLLPDGRPVLLGYEGARQALTDRSVGFNAIVKLACAPIEQFAEPGASRLGAWTDLYALGATLHFLLLGKPPVPATLRAVDDTQPPLAGQPDLLAHCSPSFLQAIDWMLKPRPADRPQSVAALRIALAPRGDAPADRTMIDLSRVPAGPAAGNQAGEEATVLMPRRDEATLLMPRQDEPTVLIPRRDEPTVLMPRRDEPTVLMPRRPEPAAPLREEPTVLMPRREAPAPADEVSLLLPLDETPGRGRSAFDADHEPTMRIPPPGTARPAAAPPGAAPAAPRGPRSLPQVPPAPPRPAGSPRPLLVAGVVVALVVLGVAAWLALKPAAVPPAAAPAPTPAPAAASG